MREYYPLLLVGAIVGLLSIVFIIAYAMVKNKKEAVGFDRNMKDSEIVRRLLVYAKPHWRSFLFVIIVMLFSIAYDIISPLIVGYIEEIVKGDFELKT
ncbi:MAG: ABC transporter ATP-binding protein, partial [Clostridia bacterium]|nr:ABC transporter ATP-binding protein [Clostridia bacterium]